MPIATHRISVLERSDTLQDPGTIETWTVVASGIRAVLGVPAGGPIERGGEQLKTGLTIQCDKAPITRLSRVRDEKSGIEYNVDRIDWLPIFDCLNGSLSETEGYV
jgi:hypothetical protein